MNGYEFYECLNVVNNEPFSLRPPFSQRCLSCAFSENLSASRLDIAALAVVQERWHFGISLDQSLRRKSMAS